MMNELRSQNVKKAERLRPLRINVRAVAKSHALAGNGLGGRRQRADCRSARAAEAQCLPICH